jgi:hypothetical protein
MGIPYQCFMGASSPTAGAGKPLHAGALGLQARHGIGIDRQRFLRSALNF